MRRIVRVMFAVSDVAARLLLFAGVIIAVIYPFVVPTYAEMTNIDLSTESVLVTVFIAVMMALGAYLLLRRSLLGLLLLLMPCFGLVMAGSTNGALWYGVFVMFVFSTPFLLSIIEVKRET